MFKRKLICTAVATSALITVPAMSTAQESVTSTATVTVSNSFTLTETAPLNFGSLAVFQDLDLDNDGDTTVDTPAVYTVNADGSGTSVTPATYGGATDVRSTMTVLTAGTPATYTVSNAARFTDLFVYFDTGTNTTQSFTLTNPSADPTANSTFTGTVAIGTTQITSGPNSGNAVSNSGSGFLRTDNNGEAGFSVGATLSPNPAATAINDGTYTGNFTVIVQY